MDILQLKNISHSYLQSNKETISILNHLNFILAMGESAAVVGPSGSGKSTFLNIAGTMLRPWAGDVLIAHKNTNLLKEGELAELRNSQISFIFQQHFLLPHLTVLENILLPHLANKNKLPQFEIERGRDLLSRVGLEKQTHNYPNTLSGGELQRVAVLRAFAYQPKIILADEPTGSLDRKSADVVADLLFELSEKEKTSLLIVTHDEKLAKRCTHKYLLENGELIANEFLH